MSPYKKANENRMPTSYESKDDLDQGTHDQSGLTFSDGSLEDSLNQGTHMHDSSQSGRAPDERSLEDSPRQTNILRSSRDSSHNKSKSKSQKESSGFYDDYSTKPTCSTLKSNEKPKRAFWRRHKPSDPVPESRDIEAPSSMDSQDAESRDAVVPKVILFGGSWESGVEEA